jgi:hypothetical protein
MFSNYSKEASPDLLLSSSIQTVHKAQFVGTKTQEYLFLFLNEIVNPKKVVVVISTFVESMTESKEIGNIFLLDL